MKFTAAGDAIIQRRIPDGFKGFEEIIPFVMRGDARFFNLETTLNYEGECYASQFSGGTYIRTNPEMLFDLQKFGFNMTSANNNHAMDFSYDGLLATIDYLNDSGIIHGGMGRNLDEATAPRYLETENGRVALISVSTSFEPSMMAGMQSGRVPGRPGVNGVRVDKKYSASQEEVEFIKTFAEKMGVNCSMEIYRKEGYIPPLADNEAEFGDLKFFVGDKTECVHTLNEQDMKRIEMSIYEAKLQADYIFLSVHSHQLSGDNKENVPKFLQELAHRCIDMGANAVVGHGPHLLRPVEVYKDCPIFYSLGDFVLQLYNIDFAPEDFFVKYGMTARNSVHELLKKRSHDFTVGLMADKKMNETVIPYWETKDGKLTKLEFLPIELAMEGNKSEIGLPRVVENPEFFDRFAKMSDAYGVKMTLENGIIKCEW